MPAAACLRSARLLIWFIALFLAPAAAIAAANRATLRRAMPTVCPLQPTCSDDLHRSMRTGGAYNHPPFRPFGTAIPP